MRRHAFLFRPWVCRFILTAAVAGGLATLAPPYLQEAEARPHAAAPAPERAHHPEHAHLPEPDHHPEHAHLPEPDHHPEPAHHPEPGHHPEPAHPPEPGHHPEPDHHPEPGHHPEHGNGPLAEPGQLPKPRLKADPKADKPDSIGPGAFIRGPKPI